MGILNPPPVRRLPLDGESVDPVVAPSAAATDSPAQAPAAASRTGGFSSGRRVQASALAVDRMAVEHLSIAYGPKLAVDDVSLPIRQGEVLALIGRRAVARPPSCVR